MADPAQLQFDVLLAYNRKDESTARALAEALRERGIKVWFDEWELEPGRPWREVLERIIETTKSAAVLIGYDGIGPWENREMSGCLSEFVDRRVPVIPVLLPNCMNKPKLPVFLKQFTWVDLRSGFTQEGLKKLIWGITGEKPELESDNSVPTHKDEICSKILWIALFRFLSKKILLIAVVVLAIIGAVIAIWRWHKPTTSSQYQTEVVSPSEPATSQTGRLDAAGSQPSEQEDRTKVTPPVKQHFIVITMVPPFEDGNPNKLYPIEGTVGSVDPAECRVVVYVFDGQLWWIQPDIKNPWTEIAKDSWSTRTRPGVRYAALLVRNNAKLPTRTDKLPELSDYVLARYEKTSLLEERRLP